MQPNRDGGPLVVAAHRLPVAWDEKTGKWETYNIPDGLGDAFVYDSLLSEFAAADRLFWNAIGVTDREATSALATAKGTGVDMVTSREWNTFYHS